MNRIFFAVCAIIAFASCAKNEVVSVVDGPQEIVYQNYMGTATKVLDESSTPKYKFVAYANWTSKEGATPVTYIEDAIIENIGSTWKHASEVYYWPKDGSLQFYAWSDYTENPSLGSSATVGCDLQKGIVISNYTLSENKNKNLLIAAPSTPEFGSIVPMVFDNVLTKLSFSVKGPDADDPLAKNPKMYLNSIVLKSVYGVGNYTQFPTGDLNWNFGDTKTNITVYTNLSDPGLNFSKESLALTPNTDEGDYYIVIPQVFGADAVIEVTYTFFTYYHGQEIKSVVTATKPLKDIYNGKWEPGIHYSVEMTIRLNEVQWRAYGVKYQDWLNENNNSYNNNTIS